MDYYGWSDTSCNIDIKRIHMNLLFIPSLLSGDYRSFFCELSIVALFWVMVFVASFIDLRTGIKASKAVGNFRTTSSGLRQTLRKDREYMAIMSIAFLLDFALSYLTTLSDIVGIFGIFKIPFLSILALIFILIIEFISVKENIEKKRGSKIIPKETIDVMTELIEKFGDEKLKAIAEILKGEKR